MHDHAGHTHGAGVRLEPEAAAILTRGLRELLDRSADLAPIPTQSQRYPLPITRLVYASTPDPADVRAAVETRLPNDPVAALEDACVLLELIESNQPDINDWILDDAAFTTTAFKSKRCNGWIATIGNTDRNAVIEAVNAHWQFTFVNGPARATNVYALLNMLGRYAFVYGKVAPGDAHAASHFIEDYTPGVLVCRAPMSDLEHTLTLAAMKLGVPAVVPPDFPFPLGRPIQAATIEAVVQAVVAPANVRRLLKTPDMPQMPAYCDTDHQKQKVARDVIWGETDESFFVVRKGSVESTGTTVEAEPTGPMGIVVTIDAEPLDAFDLQHVEQSIYTSLAMMDNVGIRQTDSTFGLWQAAGSDLDPARIGEVLIAAIQCEWPKLKNVRVEILFDTDRLRQMAPAVRAERSTRRETVDSATEESVDQFVSCIGCSPFAPDHVCILTPQRLPQCGRAYAALKMGALYAYDDMTSIHHRHHHADINSFGVFDKGRCLDPTTGEWEGANAAAERLSGGRTKRVQLHSLDEAPHTGCGCFRLVMFKTDTPREGIGIMSAGYEGTAPDGRSWRDLHYSLAGKQTPGIAGATPAYLRSDKFLRAHGGWHAVVWVDPKIAAAMNNAIPDHVDVGPVIDDQP